MQLTRSRGRLSCAACSILALCLAAAATPRAHAQKATKPEGAAARAERATTKTDGAAAKAAGAAERRLPREVRQAAVLSLEAAADELRDVEDYAARAALSAEVVRLLASRNPARCRRLLDSLFDAALEARQSQAAPPASARQDSTATARPDLDAVLRRVVKTAAALDPDLARSYAGRYAEARRREVAAGQAGASPLPPAVADLYLRLASEMVAGDPALAAETARRSLAVRISGQTLVFLETLRRADARLADEFFAAALQAVALRGASEINELFLLHSYAVAPQRVISVADGRLVQRQIPEYQGLAAARAADADAAGQYLHAAARILTDPRRYASGVEHLASGAAGDLYLIRVIEPEVRARVPALSEPLAQQQNYLESLLGPAVADAARERVGRWHDSRAAAAGGRGEADALDNLARRADEITDPDRRDQAYYNLAASAARAKRYDLALSAVEKMSAKNREAAAQFVRYAVAEAKIGEGDLEDAERWARGDAEAVRRAYLLTLVADAHARGRARDVARATELLGEVERIAAALGTSREGVAALAGAAGVYSRYDDARSAQLLAEAVRSANKVAGFDGETAVTRNLQIGDFFFSHRLYDDGLGFAEVVGRQGRRSFHPTLQEVQAIKERLPRLRAIIAACAGALAPAPEA